MTHLPLTFPLIKSIQNHIDTFLLGYSLEMFIKYCVWYRYLPVLVFNRELPDFVCKKLDNSATYKWLLGILCPVKNTEIHRSMCFLSVFLCHSGSTGQLCLLSPGIIVARSYFVASYDLFRLIYVILSGKLWNKCPFSWYCYAGSM